MGLLGIRNRTSVLSALLLSNYSEFALIIAAMGVSAGWLSPHWLLSLSLAVSAGFIISAIANPRSVSLASRFAQRLPARPPHKIHPEERPIELGAATAIVLGMGRVSHATYQQLSKAHGYSVLGVEHNPLRVHKLRELRSFGYGQVTVAAVASYQEDVEELQGLGLHAVIRLYEGAEQTLADRSVTADRQVSSAES